MNYEIGFIGAGKMGGAILSALIGEGGCVKPGQVLVCDANPEARLRFASRGTASCSDPLLVATECKTIFLAVKPQDFDALLSTISSSLGSSQLVVSIAAGKTLAKIRSLLGSRPKLVRVMPNLAALVGQGMMVCTHDGSPTPADLKRVATMLGKCGVAKWLDESQFDNVTALSGSGPAFFTYALKAMADGAERLGMLPEDAFALALQTMLGTSAYLVATGMDADSFIKAVCSPKGTTEAGMDVLRASSVAEDFAATIAAAARRSEELGAN